MLILTRVRMVLTSPRACWVAIAAEGDTSRWLFRRYLPAMLLPGWLVSVALSLSEDRSAESRTRERAHYRQQADGTLELVATSEGFSLPAFETALLMLPLLVAVALAGVLVMRRLVLWRAPRFGAAADHVAATKLVIYSSTPAFLVSAIEVPWLAEAASLAAIILFLVLLYHGAPRLLPPSPGQEGAISRSAVLMALLAIPIMLLIWVPLAFAFGMAAISIFATIHELA